MWANEVAEFRTVDDILRNEKYYISKRSGRVSDASIILPALRSFRTTFCNFMVGEHIHPKKHVIKVSAKGDISFLDKKELSQIWEDRCDIDEFKNFMAQVKNPSKPHSEYAHRIIETLVKAGFDIKSLDDLESLKNEVFLHIPRDVIQAAKMKNRFQFRNSSWGDTYSIVKHMTSSSMYPAGHVSAYEIGEDFKRINLKDIEAIVENKSIFGQSGNNPLNLMKVTGEIFR